MQFKERPILNINECQINLVLLITAMSQKQTLRRCCDPMPLDWTQREARSERGIRYSTNREYKATFLRVCDSTCYTEGRVTTFISKYTLFVDCAAFQCCSN